MHLVLTFEIQCLYVSTCVQVQLPLFFVRIEFARGMLANKEDWNKLVMAAKMVSDPNIQVKLFFAKPIAICAS